MIDKSGYGKLRDEYNRESYDGEYVNNGDRKNTLAQNTFNYYQNIKSKYIEADDTCNPIIASKSISSRINMRIPISNLIYLHNDNNTTKYEDCKEFNADIVYNYIESNLYPIRNYDLLDAASKQLAPLSSTLKNNIFFDKLVPYSNDPAFPYKNLGSLTTISPENIPVLTKVIDYKNTNDAKVLKIIFNENNLIDIIKVLRVMKKVKKTCNVKIGTLSEFYIVYHIVEHFRDINSSDILPIEAYIPNTIVLLKFIISDKLARNAINENYNNGDIIKEIGYIDQMLVTIVLDYNLKSYIIWNINRNGEKNSKTNKIVYPILTSLSQEILKSSKSNFHTNKMVRFPFGNVYENYNVCMSRTSGFNMTNSAFSADRVINNNLTIDFANIINGSYSDFFDSKFNTDLIRHHFILKKDYMEFLEFMDNHENFNDYIMEIYDKLKDYYF